MKKLLLVILLLNLSGFYNLSFADKTEKLNLEQIADDIRYKNAYQFIKLERYDKALQLLGEYIEIYINGIHRNKAIGNIADIYFMRFEYLKAIKYYNMLYEEFSDSEDGLLAYYNIGICYSKMGESQKAKNVFQRIIDENPGSPVSRQAQMQLDIEDIISE